MFQCGQDLAWPKMHESRIYTRQYWHVTAWLHIKAKMHGAVEGSLKTRLAPSGWVSVLQIYHGQWHHAWTPIITLARSPTLSESDHQALLILLLFSTRPFLSGVASWQSTTTNFVLFLFNPRPSKENFWGCWGRIVLQIGCPSCRPTIHCRNSERIVAWQTFAKFCHTTWSTSNRKIQASLSVPSEVKWD